MADAGNEKRALRRRCSETAKGLTAEYRLSAGREIARQVLASAAYRQAKTVFLYVSMPGEPDTRAIIGQALRDGKRVCVPRCRDKRRMDAVAIHGLDGLVPGAYGIPEPAAGEIVDPGDVDLALVPCVAADRHGGRLGHGAGYYDTFLQGSGAKTMCLCFERLLLDAAPADPWDVRMDAVTTECGVYPAEAGL